MGKRNEEKSQMPVASKVVRISMFFFQVLSLSFAPVYPAFWICWKINYIIVVKFGKRYALCLADCIILYFDKLRGCRKTINLRTELGHVF